MDEANLCPQPELTPADALTAAQALFSVAATHAVSLGSERDQAFLLLRYGKKVGVLKVSNAQEDVAVLDMEAAAAVHAKAVDPTLPIALPLTPTCPSPSRTRAAWVVGGHQASSGPRKATEVVAAAAAAGLGRGAGAPGPRLARPKVEKAHAWRYRGHHRVHWCRFYEVRANNSALCILLICFSTAVYETTRWPPGGAWTTTRACCPRPPSEPGVRPRLASAGLSGASGTRS
jgi:hypothetical protein